MGSVKKKKSPRKPSLSKANVLKYQNWTSTFSKAIFTDKSWVTFDGTDGWTKRWILLYLDVPVVKGRQQGYDSVMIWAGNVDQTIIEPFKVNEGVKMNNANYCNFMDKTLFEWYKS